MAKKVFVNFQFMIFYVSFNIEKCPENIDTFCLFLFGFHSRNQCCFKPARRDGTAAFIALRLWPAGALFGFLKFYFKCFI